MFKIGQKITISDYGKEYLKGNIGIISRVPLQRIEMYPSFVTEIIDDEFVRISYDIPGKDKGYWDQGSYILSVKVLKAVN